MDDAWCLVSGIWCPVSSCWCQVSSFMLVSDILVHIEMNEMRLLKDYSKVDSNFDWEGTGESM